MNKNTILSIGFGAVALFFLGFILYGVIGWQNYVTHSFSNEQESTSALVANTTEAGIYILPHANENYKPGDVVAFVNVLPNGYSASFPQMLVTDLLGNTLAVFLVILLLRFTSNLNFRQTFKFVFLFGVTTGFLGHFAYWNWYGFPSDYFIGNIVVSVIMWSAVGLILAKFLSNETSPAS